MRAAIYASMNTKAEPQDSDMQLRGPRDYCQRHGWEIAREYVDVGVTGHREQRPELDRLLAECHKRPVDAVVVYRCDRFARTLREFVDVLEEFRALGIEFVSLHEGVDTSTPNGRLVLGICASIAEFEKEAVRERVKSSLAAARARGKRIGRPRKIVDAAKIARFRACGASWRTIARRLGVSVGTVYNVAQNRSKKASRVESAN